MKRTMKIITSEKTNNKIRQILYEIIADAIMETPEFKKLISNTVNNGNNK